MIAPVAAETVAPETGAAECGFCQKQRDQVTAMASASATAAGGTAASATTAGGTAPHSTAVICDECLDLCDEIVIEEPPAPRA